MAYAEEIRGSQLTVVSALLRSRKCSLILCVRRRRLRHQEDLVSENCREFVPLTPMLVFVSRQCGESELNELFAASMPRLARVAQRFVRNREDSEDVLQESLLSAFKHLDQFEGRSSFYTWMHSIIRNQAIMHLRKAYVRRCFSIEDHVSEDGELLFESGVDPYPDVEETCAARERSGILRDVLTSVPRAHQAVIQVCDIEGLNCRDAAARLGVSLSGLKTRLHRARKLISKKIQERCACAVEGVAKNGRAVPAPKPAGGGQWTFRDRCVPGVGSLGQSAKMRIKRRGLRNGPRFRNQGYCYVSVDSKLGRGASSCTVELR